MRVPTPAFQEGDPISASVMSRLSGQVQDAYRQIARLELLFNSRQGFEIRHVRDATVVVVETPTAASTNLRVRKVRYKTNPPVPCVSANNEITCQIEWLGDTFDAFPDYGQTCLAYEDFVAEGPLDPAGGYAFDDATVFLPARFVEQQWIVEPRPVAEGGGVRPAIVTAAVAGALTLTVQPVKRSGASWVADGGTIVVPIWGNAKGDDFQTLVAPGVTSTADVIPLVQFEGEWYALQYFWFYAKTPNASIARGDCGL